MKRRWFLQLAAAIPAAFPTLMTADQRRQAAALRKGSYSPARITNEYSLFLPGEREALSKTPAIEAIQPEGVLVRGKSEAIAPGQEVDEWVLLAVTSINGTHTAVVERVVSHQGAIIYVTQEEGVILRITKGIGSLSNIRPRQVNAPDVQFKRETPYRAGPDRLGAYILDSNEDPCYENIAALGAEYIGWTLVGNEQAGPSGSLFLEADGRSREVHRQVEDLAEWAPDMDGLLFDPTEHLPDKYPDLFQYRPGFSKRTLLGGYLPVAETGVWNSETRSGYEVMVLLPPGEEAKPMARVRAALPEWTMQEMHATRRGVSDRFWNARPEQFYSELAGVANRWQHFFEDKMRVEIPDPWLLDAARAGIMLARCSYRGLRPTYQIGEGGYTKIPERSHALFPVAHYEFIWAHQLWNLAEEAEPYFAFYLNNYILPDGNFLYNTQDQVEAPLNTGVFLWNSARAYDYTGDIAALQNRLPVLRRMIDYVLKRYEYSLRSFIASDRRYGLIWGSPEADLGEPDNDFPNSHPFYFQNSTWTWRGLHEHARVLVRAGREHNLSELETEGKRYGQIADQMRKLVEQSVAATVAAGNEQMRAAGITPFDPDDTKRIPTYLTSYENHRFMMDWFTADWGDAALDIGHMKHRELAGEQILGLHTDGDWARTSNFMEHGTLAFRIRQDDYRPFLLTLYALCCYAADSGNRYSPEDAFLPGSYPGEGSRYGWSATVNSVLQPTMGVRWLLCYEESDREVCHLQKAAPKHWFAKGQRIVVEQCPTRFGHLSWTTESISNSAWRITLRTHSAFSGQLAIHIHPPDNNELKSATHGTVQRDRVVIDPSALQTPGTVEIHVLSNT